MDVQSKINALWDTASSEYDQQPGHGFSTQEEEQAWKRALASLLPHAPCDVLDVGTGTGVIAAAVADLGHRVTGIDLADGMLAKARLKASDARADKGAGDGFGGRRSAAERERHRPGFANRSSARLVSIGRSDCLVGDASGSAARTSPDVCKRGRPMVTAPLSA